MSAVPDLYLVERQALVARLRSSLGRLVLRRPLVLGVGCAGRLGNDG